MASKVLGATLEPSPSLASSAPTPSPALAEFSPAMTPSEITPSMFSPSMFTPSFFTPSYYSMLSPLAPSAPSPAPSSVETPSSVESQAPSSVEPEMQDEQESFESRVSIEPFVVQFIGDFELTNDAEMIIINVINELISPYLEMEVGDILKYIGMELEFLEDNDRANSGGQRRTLLPSIALLQVKGSLDLQGTSQDQVNAWNEQKVTSTVRNFFSVTHLVEKLLDTLVNNKGLNLNDIAIDNGNAGSIVTEERSSKESTNNSTSSGGSSFVDYIQDETVLLIAGICGGVLLHDSSSWACCQDSDTMERKVQRCAQVHRQIRR
jgi:hypothetical protein